MNKLNLPGAVCALACMCGIVTSANAVPVGNMGTWTTTLQARDLDGDTETVEAYYDTALGITWLANANYDGINTTWEGASSWVADLDINGVRDWRLPTVTDTGAAGCEETAYSGTDCGYNVDTDTGEMAHLYYVTLGNLAHYDTGGNERPSGEYGLINTGPFSNIQNDRYWTSTPLTGTGRAWYFGFAGGHQDSASKSNNNYAWAVHTGPVGAAIVPVPAAIWLFGFGLLGLVGIARKKAA